MQRTATLLLNTAAAVALVVGCGSDGGRGSDGPRADAPTTDGASDVPSGDAPSFPEGTARQTAESSGEWDLVLKDVRVGEHDGFDRVVLEFRGMGIPGWTVSYVDEAVLEGSGEVVRIRGEAIVDIYASGTTFPASDSYGGPRRFVPRNGGSVEEVYVGGTFEGYTQVLAGIDDAPVPFRVFTLVDPPRLVVDLADEDLP